jgi:hypothetical protein
VNGSKPVTGNWKLEMGKVGMLETLVGMCHNCARVWIPGDKEQTAYEMQPFSIP